MLMTTAGKTRSLTKVVHERNISQENSNDELNKLKDKLLLFEYDGRCVDMR